MIKNTKYFMKIKKLLYGFILFFCISIVDNTVIANDSLSVDNIYIDIISQDITLARNKATKKAIRIGLEKLLSWKLNNKDYNVINLKIKNSENIEIKNFVTGYKIHYEVLSNINYKADFSVFYNLKEISAWLDSHSIYFYDNSDIKTMSFNANFKNFKNWRLLITNLKNIDEIIEYNILSISYDNALIRASINIKNESSLFSVFNKSRIDIQKIVNVHNGYNISLIDLKKDSVESLNIEPKKDTSILLTE
jgi:hypothetical protein